MTLFGQAHRQFGIRLLLALIVAVVACCPISVAATPLWPGQPLCYATSGQPQADDALGSLRFQCQGTPDGYQTGSIWLRTDLKRLPVDRNDVALMVHQTRFDRLAVAFSYADGTVEWQRVESGDFGAHWRMGGQIEFEAPVRDAPLVALTMRVDRLASVDLLRTRLVSRGSGAMQSGILAALIGAALTLLLIGAIYNLSLAIAVRRFFLAWHGAWATCVLTWGVIWSQLDLLVVPGIAGTVSAQTCTFLACLAITMATVSTATAIGPTMLPRRAAIATLALGIVVALIGIPATLVRGAAIEWLGNLLGIAVLADLAAVIACLGWAWRRGSAEARDLAIAWSVPMAALAFTQLVDIGGALWGGGAQILVLFATAWQTLWLSIAVTRRLARLRIERDHARAAEMKASELAGRDPLTGLHNRRGFVERVASLLNVARSEAAPVALLLVDVDRFKSVNDLHGHEVGDIVLCAIAARLQRWESAMCAVGRLGGEEFALLIGGIHGFALARFADSVRREIEACDHREVIGDRSVTVSIGVAEARGASDFQQLYRLADQALYAAKQAGRNQVALRHLANAPARSSETARAGKTPQAGLRNL
jgi:diguanylate cyclase (GGDEF)-like protein